MLQDTINEYNVADIIAAMPPAGRRYLAWLLSQGMVTMLEYYIQLGVSRHYADLAGFEQWAEEWEHRHLEQSV